MNEKRDHNGSVITTFEQAMEYSRFLERTLDTYKNAWLRELGGKVFNKSHFIDALVLTTIWLRERSDRLAVIEAEQEVSDMEKIYGPSIKRDKAIREHTISRARVIELFNAEKVKIKGIPK